MLHRHSSRISPKFIKFGATAASICIATGALLTLFVWRSPDPATSQETFCWGSLSRQDVAQLDDKKPTGYSSSEEPFAANALQSCYVTSTTEDLTPKFGLWWGSTSQDRLHGSLSHPADLVQQYSHLPLGGNVNGWTSPTEAAVWLPRSCSSKAGVGSGDSIQLTLQIRSGQEGKWSEQETRSRMASTLIKAAASMTRKIGCSSADFDSFKPYSQIPAWQGVQHVNDACKIPGFAPFRSATAASTIQERTTGDERRIWNCVLKQKEPPLAAFSITQNDQLISEYEHWVSPDNPAAAAEKNSSSAVLIECRNVKTLLRMAFPDKESQSGDLTQAKEHLIPPHDLSEQFISAVTKKMDCNSQSPG
ncbi:hypothetical protein [Streptomyces sp. NPDC001678]|uniref:hypothetical protein n=1 Tax=Streptomyces sp. NPDC001678 TaxID=3364599 RepID=UPI00369D4230